MKCWLFFKKLKDYIHGELSYNESREMEDHLKDCRDCKDKYEEYLGVYNAFKNYSNSQNVSIGSLSSEIINKVYIKRYNKKLGRRIYFTMKRNTMRGVLGTAVIVLFVFTGMYLYSRFMQPEVPSKGSISTITNNQPPIPVESKDDKIEMEIKDWNSLFEKIICRPYFLTNFDEETPLSDKDLITYSLNYIFANKDDESIKSIPEYDVFVKEINNYVTRIKKEDINSIAANIFGKNIESHQSINKLIWYENGYYMISPHGNEGPNLIPRIMEFSYKDVDLVSINVQFYYDDFEFSPLHTLDGTALTVDEIYEKLKDNTTMFKELPAYKKQLTFKKITEDSKERYILLEMSDY